MPRKIWACQGKFAQVRVKYASKTLFKPICNREERLNSSPQKQKAGGILGEGVSLQKILKDVDKEVAIWEVSSTLNYS